MLSLFCFIFPLAWNTYIYANTYANSGDPDGTAHNEQSHLDPHCLLFA